MKRGGNHHKSLRFLIAGVVFVCVINYLLPERNVSPAVREPLKSETSAAIQDSGGIRNGESVALASLAPERKTREDSGPETMGPPPLYGPADLPPWRKYAVPVVLDPDKAKIVIVIDDLGMSAKYTRDALALPGPLTLAFLPYAQGLAETVAAGKTQGHEIIVHMPMEPMDGALDTGSVFLGTGQTPEEFSAMLEKGLSAFDGYVGINNHMGSRLTQDRAAMGRVMAVLAERGLLFLDSRTVGTSVAAHTASAFRVPFATRDVFLDDDPSPESVRLSLEKTEKIAREKGLAIAIGHPKPDTIAALQAWLPTLAAKGFQLIPVSAAVMPPQEDAPLPTISVTRESSPDIQRP